MNPALEVKRYSKIQLIMVGQRRYTDSTDN